LYEYSKGVGTAVIELESPCLSEPWAFDGDVGRNEFNINGSLKSAVLKATILDESTGTPVVITDLKFRSVGNKPDDFFNPALVTGTVQFPELGLTFTFYQDQIGGLCSSAREFELKSSAQFRARPRPKTLAAFASSR
jgi:hypothetical protein